MDNLNTGQSQHIIVMAQLDRFLLNNNQDKFILTVSQNYYFFCFTIKLSYIQQSCI